MNFEFATSERILFGKGSLEKIGDVCSGLGNRALVICGSGSVPLSDLKSILENDGIAIETYHVTHEPDIDLINAGVKKGRDYKSDIVIGYGGGAVIDTAKAVAAMLTNPGELLDYLEVVGKGQKIPNPPLPLIAVPTTAGPGTEVTRNAVVLSPEHHVKVSMRSPMMIPRIALIDPAITYSMPPSITASTGMDALTQCLEAYVSIKANPMTDSFARQGILAGAKSLLDAYQDGTNQAAREGMCLTSLFGGLSLANGGLGAVHGFAGVIGGMFGAPHGEVCASLLPAVMKHNVKALKDSGGKEAILNRYREIAVWLTGDRSAMIEDGVKWVKTITEKLFIPSLKQIGINQEVFDEIVDKARNASSMQKNPLKLSYETLINILSESY